VIKFLLLIAVVFIVLSLMRGSRELRRPRDNSQGGRAAPPPVQQDMVECPVCHVHLPRTDALAGADGKLYCSPEHRQLANRS